ncbi:Molybdate-binding periplasmic protein precursor [Vibrio aerogenes CECT 7868]|uniref:Molybdate-binding periplasmic protein n=1 Tax=Vibrio aerogenes CECT 7868 TaxID=1216006 RepID=A0A1M5ZL76_9VIBR|nr:molybdate ABC transporter substrate-binding protein [Vibrio aerogenes]SHI24911.1 Molybdate-binding periplasmic protein precursor [Vibrio aerogenes CECT 7868]
MRARFVILLSGCILGSAAVQADEAVVAVANNFFGPMKELRQDFESVSPHHLSVSTGSTGQLYVQILQGAPFDLFFAADTIRPQKLVKSGMASGEFTYAKGTLVLWAEHPGLKAKKALSAGQFHHLAIANPKVAPYGVAAKETLEKLGLYAQLQDKLVMGKGLNPTYQFIATGNAELGFVAKSQVYKNHYKAGSYWEVPRNYYSEIKQDAVTLPSGVQNKAVIDFLKYLQSDRAQAIIKNYGYAAGNS